MVSTVIAIVFAGLLCIAAITPQANWITTQNKPFADPRQYNFAPLAPGGSLSVGSNTITLSPMPAGITSASAGLSYLYISGGTGAAEAVPITAWTPSTVTVTCAKTHSGEWMVESATNGGQEAAIASPQSTVMFPAGTWLFYAPLTLSPPTTAQSIQCVSWNSVLQAQSAAQNVLQLFGSNPSSVKGCAIQTAATSPTAGAAIQVGNGVSDNSVGAQVDGVQISCTYDGVYVASGNGVTITNANITAHHYGVHLTNLVNSDQGDDTIANSSFQGCRGIVAGLRVDNLNGVKVTGTKIVLYAPYGMDFEGGFGDVNIVGNSIEAFTTCGIELNASSSPGTSNQIITGNEISAMYNSAGDICGAGTRSYPLYLTNINANTIQQGSGMVFSDYVSLLLVTSNTINGGVFSLDGITSGNNIVIANNFSNTSSPLYAGTANVSFADFLGGPGTHYADLPAAAPGSYIWCPDCTSNNPCGAYGGGAMARRVANGTWDCN